MNAIDPAALERAARPGARLALRVEVEAREGAALRLFESAAGGEDRFYWEQPSCGRAIAGVGAIERIDAAGAERFARAAERARALPGELTVLGAPAPVWAGPLLVGGFAFDDEPQHGGGRLWNDFAPLSFVLPERLYVRDGDRAWLTVCAPIGDEAVASTEALTSLARRTARALEAADVDDVLRRSPSRATRYTACPDRPHAQWLAGVEHAVAAMAAGELEKVVVARSLGVETDVDYDAAKVLAELRTAQRACTTFAVARGERTFLGASPERLVRIEGDRLTTAALAGSAPRGRSPEEDERLARRLRESKKEQEEHAFVVREIADALGPFCEGLAHAEAPGLLALDGIQHLETPFEARLRSGQEPRPHLLDVAARLHPTPAVCGTPRPEAARWLREHEGLDRGWYAGGIGYLDAGGGGDLGVALRCGLIDGTSARLYAGAGVVAASSPEAELAETRLKLRALLSQLTEI